MTRPLRVAFPPVGGDVWIGGQNYLGNLIKALLRYVPGRITPVLFVDPDYATDLMAELEAARAEVIRDSFFARTRQPKRMISALLTGQDRQAIASYQKLNIDCLFESATYHGWACPIPALTWIPDFQHHHLQYLFSKRAWWRRELGFRLSFLGRAHVMLSSEDASSDFAHHYSWSKASTFIVPFAVPAPKPASETEIAAVKAEHGLPDQWFYCPNQFWEHKNHEVLVHALAIAVKTNPNICIVCSGSTKDTRNPDYFSRLKVLAGTLDVERNFRVLGLIPYEHVGILMQGSQALINPSKFEGWSTVVEEAKATATPMILSDIAVHKEQCGNAAVYFRSDDAAALAAALIGFVRVNSRSEIEKSENDPQRGLREFAQNFAAAIEAVANRG